jgi:hypothetical protein
MGFKTTEFQNEYFFTADNTTRMIAFDAHSHFTASLVERIKPRRLTVLLWP